MKVFVGSLVIFFCSLLAAGLVALGQPVALDVVPQAASATPPDNAATPEPGGRGDESGWERFLALRGFH